MLLKIVQAGEPVLRQEAKPLSKKEILSGPVQQLVELMRETMRDAPGVGLAAPQIGLAIQLTVIEDPVGKPEEEHAVKRLAELEREDVPFHVLFNPVLTVEDDSAVTHFEGCLSVSGWSGLVPRARGVKVEGLDEKGLPFSKSARGWYARILQHETDHLHGTLYIDRMLTRSYTTTQNQGRFWTGVPLEEIREVLGLK